jgi:hypothetical protein
MRTARGGSRIIIIGIIIRTCAGVGERKHRVSSNEDVSSSAEFDSAFENGGGCGTAADATTDFVVLAGDVPRGIRA